MFDTVCIVGGGVCGCQIAWQCAIHDVEVTLIEKNASSRHVAARGIEEAGRLLRESGLFQIESVVAAHSRIRILDLETGESEIRDYLSRCPLLLESVTEDKSIKRSVFEYFSRICHKSTILASNSSYLLPSSFISSVLHPENLVALHFHVPVWHSNAVDVMPHSRTSSRVIQDLQRFAIKIGQVPIVVAREQPGYVFNSLLNPLLSEAVSLARRGVATPEQIDLSWRTVTKMQAGPFDMIRIIGLPTVIRILEAGAKTLHNQNLKLNADYLQSLPPDWTDRAFNTPKPVVASFSLSWMDEKVHAKLKRAPRFVGPVGLIACNRLRHHFDKILPLVALEHHFFQETELCERLAEPERKNVNRELGRMKHLVAALGFDQTDRSVQSLNSSSLVPFLDTLKSWWTVRQQESIDDPSTLTIAVPDSRGWGSLGRSLAMEVIAEKRFFPAIRVVEIEAPLFCEETVESLLTEIAISQNQIVTDSPEERVVRYANTVVRFEGEKRCRQVLRKTNEPHELRDFAWLRGTRWLLIGGGRGITYEIAKSLAMNHGCTVDLVGRSPVIDLGYDPEDSAAVHSHRVEVMRTAYRDGLRPDEAWERIEAVNQLRLNLSSLQSAGLNARYHSLDVSNPSLLRAWVRTQTEVHAWDGFVYGAGWERTRLYRKRSTEELQKTLGSKLDGLENLCECFLNEPMKCLPKWGVVFGSLSGVFGGVGQVDYALANGLAATIAERYADNAKGESRMLFIDWPGWQSVGMAARSANERALRRAGHYLLSINEGVDVFYRSLNNVLVSDEERFVRLAWMRSSEIPVAMLQK